MLKLTAGSSRYFEATFNPDEIKKKLDSDADREKMEGMKRIMALMSRGQDVTGLFPYVVKCVASQNLDVKKLVYIYLVHFSEIEADAALLAFNILKKDLDGPNPLIRAHALRTLSSLRVRVIIPLVVIQIKKSAKDSSPYVRKTAANSIAKIVSMDPDQKEPLLEVLEQLLGDSSTVVIGSAVAVFNEICPERFEVIHPNYRKLCNTVADVDEWGQVSILEMLTRYARTQFLDPDKEMEERRKQKEAKVVQGEGDEDDYEDNFEPELKGDLDPDHRLLLKATFPLLQSRNAAVVLAVGALYYYVAPKFERLKVGKSLVRILHCKSIEQNFIVLKSIVTMSATSPEIFRPYLTDFFIDSMDPVHVRNLKLKVITNIANEGNIARILKEFKTYLTLEDKVFVTATIDAIGECAAKIREVMDSCMHGLVQLLNSRSDDVVAQSVLVLKQLLQMPYYTSNEVAPTTDALGLSSDNVEERKEQHNDVVKLLAGRLDQVNHPHARAAIVWIIGEYLGKVDGLTNIAPDVLRKLAKTFPEEDDVVKLQTLNLAAKLYIFYAGLAEPETAPVETKTIFNTVGLLLQYVFNLAKYDLNYDIRDRCRLLRKILVEDKSPFLKQHAKALFVTEKPSPITKAPTDSSLEDKFALGTLAHVLNQATKNYLPIPEWAIEKPPSTIRNSKKAEWEEMEHSRTSSSSGTNAKKFWAEEEGDEEDFYGDENSHHDQSVDEAFDDFYDDATRAVEDNAQQEYAEEDDFTDDATNSARAHDAIDDVFEGVSVEVKKLSLEDEVKSTEENVEDFYGQEEETPIKAEDTVVPSEEHEPVENGHVEIQKDEEPTF
jgi:AP-3 complex subunit beta